LIIYGRFWVITEGAQIGQEHFAFRPFILHFAR
jgi:hypothetical protein